jgi:hypothetical protein
MEKIYIVSMGYNYVGLDKKEDAANLLTGVFLNKEYIDNSYVYTPIKDHEITLTVVDKSKIRALSIEEVENKELKSAQSSAEYYKSENTNLKKEIEELKCQIKLLAKKTEE